MAQTKRQIESALAAAGGRPKHRFGQNFMVDANLVRVIAASGEIEPGDLVIEVGPGTGSLTEELLERVGDAGRVVGVEIDRDLARSLRDQFANEPRFSLIQGDALAGKHGLNVELARLIAEARAARPRAAGRALIRLVANLPYNIASPLVVELLLAGVDVLAFTVQKEVADRLRALPRHGKDYGPLSVAVQTLAGVEVLRTIPPEAFWPRPKVDSALVRLRRREPPNELAGRERGLGRFVTSLFSQRRKTLRKVLAATVDQPAPVLVAAGLTGEERPEQVDPPTLLRLYLAAGAPGAGVEPPEVDGSMRAS